MADHAVVAAVPSVAPPVAVDVAPDVLAKRDWLTELGLIVVGLAAAILTFTTWRDLAEAVGITGYFIVVPLAYLVPVTVDAAGVVAARVWLKRKAVPEAVQFAKMLAWCCITGSILANAGQHGMAAFGIAPPWWVVVLVSAVPPATLGAVVHLAHLLGRVAEPDDEVDVESKARELISKGAGRGTLVRSLPITEHEAKGLLKKIKINGSSS